MGVDRLQSVRLPWPMRAILDPHPGRLAGSGYPFGTAGGATLFELRTTAVADVFQAIPEPRPYRHALGRAGAPAEINRRAGRGYERQMGKARASDVAEAGSQDLWTQIESTDFPSTVNPAPPGLPERDLADRQPRTLHHAHQREPCP